MNTFVWADLSTFDLCAAKDFYTHCFGWKYQQWEGGYHLCNSAGKASVGLFTMPAKFQVIKMPSFWMSYIQVEDIDQTVLKAEQHGAKIKVAPEPGPGGGKIALIRDPAGAGFTCYQGDAPSEKNPTHQHGHMAWNELHASKLGTVKPFYQAVFGWTISKTNTPGRYEIFTAPDTPQPIAGIKVSSNAVKGDKEYWGVYFSVNDLATATNTIQNAGGSTHQAQPLGSQPSVLAYDSQGAAFYLIENKNPTSTSSSSGSS